MEDLSGRGVATSIFFGPTAPHNLDVDLEAKLEAVVGGIPSVEQIVMLASSKLAALHRLVILVILKVMITVFFAFAL